MKKIFSLRIVSAVLAAAALAGLTPAKAQLNLSYEENFGTHAAGDPFSGPFRINLQDFDMGTLYPSLGSPGTAAGFGENGTGPQTIQGGISTLDGTQSNGTTAAPVVPFDWVRPWFPQRSMARPR